MPELLSPTVEILKSERVTGSICARFANVRGATQLAAVSCAAPLKIAKAFPQSDGGLSVCLMDCSPGLLEGDRYRMAWQLEPGTHVSITNQSFTKVHPSQGGVSASEHHIQVGDGAVLEYLPQPTMLYRDSNYRGATIADIETDSILIMADILCAGRVAHGEKFHFREYRNRIHVRYGGELIYCSQVVFKGRVQQPHHLSPAAWGDATHWGSFLVFTDRLDASIGSWLVEALRQVLSSHPALNGGVSLLPRHGVGVSMLGNTAWELQETVEALRQCTAQFLRKG